MIGDNDGEGESALSGWPAFTDLLASTSLLFVTLMAVFIFVARREGDEAATNRVQLYAELNAKRLNGGRELYDVVDDSQFVRITIRDQATFPSTAWQLADLQPEGREALLRIGAILRDQKIEGLYRQVRVVGHTDQEPYRANNGMRNWELSAARAAGVARFLVAYGGMDPCRLSATGVGPFYPRSIRDNESLRRPYVERMKMNRRIEIEIVPSKAIGSYRDYPCNDAGDGNGPKSSSRP